MFPIAPRFVPLYDSRHTNETAPAGNRGLTPLRERVKLKCVYHISAASAIPNVVGTGLIFVF